MGEALKKMAGERMKRILLKLTKNRFVGVGKGAIWFAVLGSSSATGIITIALVDEPILSFSPLG